ncbi:Hypothetical protein NTJ_15972 [Nesidiocoris tenuis]|uniref:Uncharacterized protein n=1 Tax=Nesidiocoris tenuis TaxID=355587 RepID=A0ABN7BFJ8_9HEMI|nr:Hypothetical protein NTJ_15972 [Nesidiocoris tenuis]
MLETRGAKEIPEGTSASKCFVKRLSHPNPWGRYSANGTFELSREAPLMTALCDLNDRKDYSLNNLPATWIWRKSPRGWQHR